MDERSVERKEEEKDVSTENAGTRKAKTKQIRQDAQLKVLPVAMYGCVLAQNTNTKLMR